MCVTWFEFLKIAKNKKYYLFKSYFSNNRLQTVYRIENDSKDYLIY